MSIKRRYSDYNGYLRSIFGQRVQKITVDTGLGCPNRDGTIASGGCIYCNSKGSGSGLFSKGLSINEQIERGRRAMIRRYKASKFLVYFQSYTNTYTSCANMKRMYDEALSVPGMVGMAIGTRPDCVDDEKLDLIASYASEYLVWVEYGLQSVHDSTLKRINRGHDFECFKQAAAMTRERGVNVCAHVILGLPGEDRAMMLETAKVLGDLGIDGVKLHLLYVVKGTPLEEMWKRGEYRCLEQREYVDILCDFLELLPKEVIIQRVTGDPHPEELAAPAWSVERNETFKMIQDTMVARDSFQGKLFSK
ncbi:MAG: TIGR01212 family radical SAM protein [Desulfobacteraceae bacterium]|nr:TIGR01212 family radical SAM protein [Desulfobacteraceae bacterium]